MTNPSAPNLIFEKLKLVSSHFVCGGFVYTRPHTTFANVYVKTISTLEIVYKVVCSRSFRRGRKPCTRKLVRGRNLKVWSLGFAEKLVVRQL